MTRFALISIEVIGLLIFLGTAIYANIIYKRKGGAYGEGSFFLGLRDVAIGACVIGGIAFIITGFVVPFEREYRSYNDYTFEVVDDFGCLSFQGDLKVIKNLREINYLKSGKPIILKHEWVIFGVHNVSPPIFKDVKDEVVIDYTESGKRKEELK